VRLSLVVPCLNEAENLPRLFAEIDAVVREHALDAEVILVDDGSTDATAALLVAQARKDRRYKALVFRRNFGQTAAMVAGIDHASGEIIVPLDADLQNDPQDIPRLLKEIDSGFDVVSGWRKDRQDKLLSRRFPSIIANRLIAMVGGVRIHDYGCTLKAYRKNVIAHVNLYGEMHRFIPIYASWAGGKVTEIVVNHRPRTAGTSKYGIGRTFKVILDLLTVKLLGSYATKPIYFFGFFGFVLMLAGMVCGSAVAVIKILQVLGELGYWQHVFSLGLLGAFLFLVGMQAVMMGLLAELQVRTYHESQRKPIYLVKETVGVTPLGPPQGGADGAG
jgi:glycosyltransferase involved in cell wall biosynthesis